MVLRKVSTIIPLGNLAKRGTSKAFETKSRIGSEPGSLRDRDSWISGMDGFEECEVLVRGPCMDCSMSNVCGMCSLFGKSAFSDMGDGVMMIHVCYAMFVLPMF